MVSTQNMKATIIQNQYTKVLNKEMLKTEAAGYKFTFSEGLLKKDATVDLKLQIDDTAQDGWIVSMLQTDDKEDLKLTFNPSSNTIKAKNFVDNQEIELKDANVIKKGSNVIRFQMTKRGYIVEVNENNLQDYNPSDKKEAEVAVSAALAKVSQIKVSGLTAKAKSLVIGSTRYQ